MLRVLVMSVEVLIGYQDEDDEYHGYLGALKRSEYGLLKKLSEKCTSQNVLSIDKLKLLSDAKDHIAKARTELYEIEKEFSKTEKQRLKEVKQLLGEALASFDTNNKDAPQLEFLLSFCIIDAFYSEESEESGEYESKNFHYMDTEDPLLQENVESGAMEYIDVSEDFVNTIYDWIDCDGRRIINEASMAEEWWDTLENEIKWWKEHIDYLDDRTEYNLTTMIFRCVRNNMLKCDRIEKPILSEIGWSKRIEIL